MQKILRDSIWRRLKGLWLGRQKFTSKHEYGSMFNNWPKSFFFFLMRCQKFFFFNPLLLNTSVSFLSFFSYWSKPTLVFWPLFEKKNKHKKNSIICAFFFVVLHFLFSQITVCTFKQNSTHNAALFLQKVTISQARNLMKKWKHFRVNELTSFFCFVFKPWKLPYCECVI